MPSTHALTKVTTLSEDDVLRIDLDPDNAAVAETERGITAGVLTGGAKTQAEIDAGVTVVNMLKAPGNVLRYGTNTTPGSTDLWTAIDNALSVSSAHKVVFPDEAVATSDRHVLTAARTGAHITGSGYNSVVKLIGTHSSNKGLFTIEANGDNDGGTVDGADNVTIENLRLDGSGATMSSGVSAGIRCFHGEGHIFQNIWSHGFTDQGILLQSIGATAEFSVVINNAYCYDQTATAGKGIGIESANDDANRVFLDNVYCYGNGVAGSGGRGINIGSGSATINNAYCWDNGVGGIKTSGNDNQHVVFNNCHMDNNTDAAALGFTTTGTFRLLEFNNCTFDNNGDHGLSIGHTGKVLISNCYARGNGDVGAKIDAGEIQISNFVAESNTNQGLNLTAGNLQAACIKTESNGQQGVRIGSAGIVHVNSIISINDCTGGVATDSVRVQPAAGGDYYFGAINAADSAANVTNAVNLVNSDVNSAVIGKITATSITNSLADTGTDTIYLSRLRTPRATTTELEDITDDVNTSPYKVEGSVYFNITTNQPVWALGAAASNVWVDATGATAHTPA